MANIFSAFKQAKQNFDNQSQGGFFDDLRASRLKSPIPKKTQGVFAPNRMAAKKAVFGASMPTERALTAGKWLGQQGQKAWMGAKSIPELRKLTAENKEYEENKFVYPLGKSGTEWRSQMISGRDRMSEQLKGMGMSPETPIDFPKRYPKQVSSVLKQEARKPEPKPTVFQRPPRNEDIPTPHLVDDGWEYNSDVYDIFGDDADNALRTLKREDGEGGITGENIHLQTGKEVDRSNEGYDDNNKLEYFRPSKDSIAPGDIKGEDGLYHSMDRGLFRINNRTFFDFQQRKDEQLRELGITSYDDMLDPHKNILFAKILFDEQGWKAWAAAAKDTFIASVKMGPFGGTTYNNPFSQV